MSTLDPYRPGQPDEDELVEEGMDAEFWADYLDEIGVPLPDDLEDE